MTEFEVEIDGKKEELEGDKTKTLFAFDFEIKAIKVTKAGFKDAEEVKDYKIVDGENKISVVLEIKKVPLKNLPNSRKFQLRYLLFSVSTYL